MYMRTNAQACGMDKGRFLGKFKRVGGRKWREGLVHGHTQLQAKKKSLLWTSTGL